MIKKTVIRRAVIVEGGIRLRAAILQRTERWFQALYEPHQGIPGVFPESLQKAFEAELRPTRADYITAYPILIAQIIVCSTGYATPSTAAMILMDAHGGRENWCEWVYSCYDRSAVECVKHAIRTRRYDDTYMASYPLARAITERAATTGEEPTLGSWF